MLKHGFHYLPGTQSYRQSDLDDWLPRLTLLKARWLILQAPINRAIPEYFIARLLSNQIEPVIHFANLPIGGRPADDLQPLFEAYAHWGIRYLSIYDRPNLQKSWQASYWGQANLVETFLDQYIPLANASLQAGLTPIFPPLEPGGDYWDTAFLQAALHSLRRRRALPLLKKMVLGAYAGYQRQELNWGAGGPERWPLVRPYSENPATQDQRSFRIFDWYLAIARATLGKNLPIFLFGMGAHQSCPASKQEQAKLNLQIVQLLAGQAVDGCDELPGEVIAGAFSLTQANETQPGEIPAALSDLAKWIDQQTPSQPQDPGRHPIDHYLLLPAYDWGIADYHLEAIRPFVKKYRPTIGFSSKEAARARRVTIIGNRTQFPDTLLNELRASGCVVERVEANGTELAPLLAAL